MKLELKHLAPYLPYNITYNYTNIDRISVLTSDVIARRDRLRTLDKIKPILRPLSEIDGTDYFRDINIDYSYPDFGHFERSVLSGHAPYNLIEELLSQHYDVFNLIPNNLAIDVNTLNP